MSSFTARQQLMLAASVGAFGFMGFGGPEVVRYALSPIPGLDRTTMSGGDVVHREACENLKGYDVVVRRYYAPRQSATPFARLPWWRQQVIWIKSVFSDEAYESINEGKYDAKVSLADNPVNRVSTLRRVQESPLAPAEQDARDRAAASLAARGKGQKMDVLPVSSTEDNNGDSKNSEHVLLRGTNNQPMDTYATLSLVPSGEGVSRHGSNSSSPTAKWEEMMDSSTHQTLVKCSNNRAALRDPNRCVADGSDLETPYLRVMSCALAFFQLPLTSNLHVGVVGCGGGALPMFLQHHFSKRMSRLDLVDAEPRVLDAASTYLGMRRLISAPLSFFAMDGEEFLLKSRDKYDLLLVDAQVGNAMPENMRSGPFVMTVKKSLSGRGVAAFNVPAEDALFFETVRRVFGEHKVLESTVPNSPNRVIFAAKNLPEGTERRHIVQRATKLSRETQLPFDLGAHLPLVWNIW